MCSSADDKILTNPCPALRLNSVFTPASYF